MTTTPFDSNLQALIEKAKEALAQRTAVSTSQIQVVDAAAVAWPDSSLGCPQSGMEYAQMLTPGYLIVLEHAGKKFEYHAGRDASSLIYCENPTPPIPGTPSNT